MPRDERAGPLTPYTPAFGQREPRTSLGDPDHELAAVELSDELLARKS
ncbi:hypothetical protein [Streptomyces sp. NPDC050546]